MFSLFKKKQHDFVPLGSVRAHLKAMGYNPTQDGLGVAFVSVNSGYNDVETASYIALNTLALDIREAGANLMKLMAYETHAVELLKTLKNYKDTGKMREEIWKNHANAIFHVSGVGGPQEEWVTKVLSDPVSGQNRLATSRVS